MSKLNLELECKPELSVSEFNALYAEVVKQAHNDLEVIKGLKNGESYNPKVGLNYWSKEDFQSDDLQNMDPDEMIEAINDFKEACKEHEDKNGYYVCQKSELSGEYEDEYAELDAFFLDCEWNVPIKEVTENMINNEFKHMTKFWLAPKDTANYNVNYVDCKLLTLFKEGKIDWNTLRTLVYSDCSI